MNVLTIGVEEAAIAILGLAYMAHAEGIEGMLNGKAKEAVEGLGNLPDPKMALDPKKIKMVQDLVNKLGLFLSAS